MKISVVSQGAGWVIDDIASDYKKYTYHEIVGVHESPDLIWVANLWSFKNIHRGNPSCPVVLNVHHIDETKIDEYDFELFNKADHIVVPNEITEKIAKKYFNRPITRIPYWVLDKTLDPSDYDEFVSLRKELKAGGKITVGSFQRDTQRNGTPKLSKGPDILFEALELLNKEVDIRVVLAGWNRGYLTKRLKGANIPYVLMERTKDINLLYEAIDWYFVTSRTEGGPQAVLETAFLHCNVLSTPVGIAPDVLHPNCICDTPQDFAAKVLENLKPHQFSKERMHNHDKIVTDFLPKKVVSKWDKFFEEMRNGMV